MIILFLLVLLLTSLPCWRAGIVAEGEDGTKERVAIAVQGSKQDMLGWLQVYDLMKSKDHARLFLLSYGSEPIVEVSNALDGTDKDQRRRDVVFIHAPNSTWTSGRNTLARHIFSYEQDYKVTFRYWLFADADMLNVTCKSTPAEMQKNSVAETSAFCLGRHIQYFLLSHLSYAQVFFLGALGSEFEFYRFDCGDAQFHAIHRAAVPIFLPYVELLDGLSWWESQQFVWRLSAGCLPQAGIGAGMLSKDKTVQQHGSYPRGTFLKSRAKAIAHIFGKRGLSPHPVDGSLYDTVQGDCANQQNQIDERNGRPNDFLQEFSATVRQQQHADNSAETSASGSQTGTNTTTTSAAVTLEGLQSIQWRSSDVYHYCLHALKSRFEAYMIKGNLIDIDGPPYTQAEEEG